MKRFEPVFLKESCILQTKTIALILTSCCSLVLHASPIEEDKPIKESSLSQDEQFMERLIAEFWKDGDHPRVKENIAFFLATYPNSHLKDHFQAILAEICLHDGEFQEALKAYENIRDAAIIEKTILNKLHCYYELKQFDSLIKEGTVFVDRPIEELAPRKDEFHFLMGEAFLNKAIEEKDPQQQQELAKQSSSHYAEVERKEYQAAKNFALAEIALLSGNYQEASHAYHKLAKSHTDKKEDLLFKAALAESHFDLERAASTFVTVASINGKRKVEALFNQLIVHFQMEQYEKALSLSERIKDQVDPSLQNTLQFIAGKSAFALEKYQEASQLLSSYLEANLPASEELKNALFVQMKCAHYLNNEPLFEQTFDRLVSLFPDDPEIPKALLMHAILLKEKGDGQRAEEKLHQIRDQYPSFEDQEGFLFEYGVLTYQNKKWKESANAFRSYLSEFDEGKRGEAAWKFLLASAVNLYKEELSNENPNYTKTEFFSDLTPFLDKKALFAAKEWLDYILLYSKVCYETSRYDEAIRILQDHVFSSVEEGSTLQSELSEAHYLAALCHSQLRSYSAFCMHLEKALELNKDLYESSAIHKQLFNAYISLAGFGSAEDELCGEESERTICLDQAADHLYIVFSQGEVELKTDNSLWLADHYYNRAQAHFHRCGADRIPPPKRIEEAIHRADHVYRSILSTHRLSSSKEELLSLQEEWLKWAKVLGYCKDHQKKAIVLQHFLKQTLQFPSEKWEKTAEALLELGNAYLAMQEPKKALETFSFLRSTANLATCPTVIANQAALQEARLQFEFLDPTRRQESSKEVGKIITDLKNLQIRKTSIDFPVHIEAALTYAEIRTRLCPKEKQTNCYRFFLGRLQEDFSSKEDPLMKTYLAEIEKDQEKKEAFSAYMQFLRGEQLRLKGKEMKEQGKSLEMEDFYEKALSLYQKIQKNPYAPKALTDRVEKSIDAIHVLTSYADDHFV